MKKNKTSRTNGFSLIEILIVVGLFATLSLVATLAITFSLRGSNKSEAIGNLRSKIDNATQIMSRQLRNASSIQACTGLPVDNIQFYDQTGTLNMFSCLGVGSGDGYLASSSANLRITSPDINITSCVFTCTQGNAGSTDTVLINIKATNKATISTESTTIDISTSINLRNY